MHSFCSKLIMAGVEVPRSAVRDDGNVITRFFKIQERGTTIVTELRAGVVSYLTMSYILLVNPQIISQSGVPPSDVVVATAVSAGVASIIAGIGGNLPFGLAPGTGLSAYLTYGLVLSGSMTHQQATTACLCSGIALGLCAAVGLSTVIMRIIPRSVKLATVVGMGLLIALIGMISINLVVPNRETLVTLGELGDYHIWLSLVGLVLTGTLLFHQVKGGVLLSILILTIIVWSIDGSAPHRIAEVPRMRQDLYDNINLQSWSVHMLPAFFGFLIVGIFDVSGVMFGLSALAKMVDAEGHVPGSLWAFISTAIGTVVAAMGGCSPIIIHVESAAGIREGGRTGLTAVTIGVLFLLSVFLAPLFMHVPMTATAPILILVGAMMIAESQHIDWADMSQAIPAFLTCMMMPFTFSIPNGILFGIGTSLAFFITTGEFLYFFRSSKSPRSDDGLVAYGTINGNAPPDETTHLKPPQEEPLEEHHTLFDEQLLTRRLSLLLPKEEADVLEHNISPAATVRKMRSTSSGSAEGGDPGTFARTL